FEFCFFFSSRRRHTSSKRDWSSDVCSSDLVVIQSTLIGGGYATGREVVQYGAGYGALGWITGLTILVGFAIMAFLMFEIARLFRAYDYRSLVKQVLGPFWFLYD